MIKEFTVGIKHTVNLGNYESMHVEASVMVTCEDEDWNEVRAQAQGALTQLLDQTFKAQAKPSWFGQIPAKRNQK